jgi:serine/threonine protein kinase
LQPAHGDEPTFVPTQVGEEAAHVPVRVGDVLEGKWRLERKLGEGGMGTVFLAHDLLLDRKVAIKLLGVALANDPELVMRFEREARLTAGLEHPNIVPVYAVGRFRGRRPFMVMKALDGVTLHHLVKSKGPLHARDLLHLARQMAAGLDFIHSRGFIHRDIKAANIFVGPDGHATILDFGILRASRGAEAITRTGLVMGTPHYMSPEQAKGIRDLDHRSDLYAFAVLLFECAAGSLPFESDNDLSVIQMQAHGQPPDLCERASWVPRSVGDVISRALSKDPQARYPSAGDLYRAIEAAYSGLTPVPLLAPLEVPGLPTPPPGQPAISLPVPIPSLPEGYRPTMGAPSSNGAMAPLPSGPLLVGTPLYSGSNPAVPAVSGGVPLGMEQRASNAQLPVMGGMPLGMEPQRGSNPSMPGMPLGMEPQRASNPSLQAMSGGMPLGMEPQRGSNPSMSAMPLGMEPQRGSNPSLQAMGGAAPAFPPTMPLPAVSASAAAVPMPQQSPVSLMGAPSHQPLFTPGMPVPAVPGHGSPMFSGPVPAVSGPVQPAFSGSVFVGAQVADAALVMPPQQDAVIVRTPTPAPAVVAVPPLPRQGSGPRDSVPEPKPSRRGLIAAVAGVGIVAVVGLVLFVPRTPETPKGADTPVVTQPNGTPSNGTQANGKPPNGTPPENPVVGNGQVAATGQTGGVNGSGEVTGRTDVASAQNPEERAPTEDPFVQPGPTDNPNPGPSKKPKGDPELAKLAAQGKGQLRVISTRNNEPHWARVLVDGERKGSTPLSLELSIGVHKVRLEREGFQPVERQIKIAPMRPAVLRIELVP